MKLTMNGYDIVAPEILTQRLTNVARPKGTHVCILRNHAVFGNIPHHLLHRRIVTIVAPDDTALLGHIALVPLVVVASVHRIRRHIGHAKHHLHHRKHNRCVHDGNEKLHDKHLLVTQRIVHSLDEIRTEVTEEEVLLYIVRRARKVLPILLVRVIVLDQMLRSLRARYTLVVLTSLLLQILRVLSVDHLCTV